MCEVIQHVKYQVTMWSLHC